MIVALCVGVGCSSSKNVAVKRWSLKQLAEGLKSPSPDIRRESAFELGERRVSDNEVRIAMLKAMTVLAEGDPEPLVRSQAMVAAARQDAKLGAAVAERESKDSSPMVRTDAMKVLGLYGADANVPVLVESSAKDPEAQVRREAVKSLSRFKGPEVIKALIDRLGDPDLSVAQAAHEALVKMTKSDFGMDRKSWKAWYLPPEEKKE
jgi:HEAT repeat protein